MLTIILVLKIQTQLLNQQCHSKIINPDPIQAMCTPRILPSYFAKNSQLTLFFGKMRNSINGDVCERNTVHVLHNLSGHQEVHYLLWGIQRDRKKHEHFQMLKPEVTIYVGVLSSIYAQMVKEKVHSKYLSQLLFCESSPGSDYHHTIHLLHSTQFILMRVAELERNTGPTHHVFRCHIAELIELILIFGQTAGCKLESLQCPKQILYIILVQFTQVALFSA